MCLFGPSHLCTLYLHQECQAVRLGLKFWLVVDTRMKILQGMRFPPILVKNPVKRSPDIHLSQKYNLLTLSIDMGTSQTNHFVVFHNSTFLVGWLLKLNQFMVKL